MDGNDMSALGVDETEELIYRHLLRHPDARLEELHAPLRLNPQQVRRGVDRLRDLGLLWGEEPPVAADPETAVGRLTEHRLRQLFAELEQVTSAYRLTRTLRTGCPSAPGSEDDSSEPSLECLTDIPRICARIADLAHFSQDEIVALDPHADLQPAQLDQARPLEPRALRRGVRVRCVVGARVWEDPASVEYLRELVDQGARVRVAHDVRERLLVFDSRTIMLSRDSARPRQGVLLSQESGLVSQSLALFERVWTQAREMFGSSSGEGNGECPLPPVKLRVLRAMCSGDKDEVSARRVGVSLRTYRRYVASVMRLLGAGSRAHAALLARDRGWV
ncbi:helix-turn-helix transcriptional regulator [Streptomyces sp. NPDC005438]|uniref:helix-turn-helix transcriptional regulator n=1 Tax=Streptomyces sp. NPDC005438 TaxID=3156880 RepID=UPI0033AB22FB